MRYADSCCTYTEDAQGYIFTGKCIVTGKRQTVRIPGPELFAYRQGKMIQEAMPSVSADDREFLMSGISGEGWAQKFGPPKEDTENEALAAFQRGEVQPLSEVIDELREKVKEES